MYIRLNENGFRPDFIHCKMIVLVLNFSFTDKNIPGDPSLFNMTDLTDIFFTDENKLNNRRVIIGRDIYDNLIVDLSFLVTDLGGIPAIRLFGSCGKINFKHTEYDKVKSFALSWMQSSGNEENAKNEIKQFREKVTQRHVNSRGYEIIYGLNEDNYFVGPHLASDACEKRYDSNIKLERKKSFSILKSCDDVYFVEFTVFNLRIYGDTDVSKIIEINSSQIDDCKKYGAKWLDIEPIKSFSDTDDEIVDEFSDFLMHCGFVKINGLYHLNKPNLE